MGVGEIQLEEMEGKFICFSHCKLERERVKMEFKHGDVLFYVCSV